MFKEGGFRMGFERDWIGIERLILRDRLGLIFIVSGLGLGLVLFLGRILNYNLIELYIKFSFGLVNMQINLEIRQFKDKVVTMGRWKNIMEDGFIIRWRKGLDLIWINILLVLILSFKFNIFIYLIYHHLANYFILI